VIADLLAALKAVLAAPITGERGTAESLAHAAIAKAEGRVSCEAVSA
jgi:hypothetical protein